MPRSADEVKQFDYLRLLLLGVAKVGKTYTVLTTAPRPIYVINSDQASALVGARRALLRELGPVETGKAFFWDMAHTMSEMDAAIREARRGVRDGEYKTIVWDTLSNFAARLEVECMKESSNASGRPDPRVAWPEYAKRLEGICNRLLEIKAHIIVTSHYAEMGPDLTSIERTGGIVPLLGGKAKIRVPSLFQDIVFFEKNRNDNRVFNTAIRGVFGPGCRSLEGFKVVKGDVQALIRSFGTGAVDPADEEASRDDDTFIPKSFIPKSKTNKGSVRDGKA